MSDLIAINNIDLLAVLCAVCIAWVAQTKASAITAIEFVVYAVAMNSVIIFGVSSPFLWLVFAAICYCAAYFHIICTSHPFVITSFILPMLYNVGMFYDWGAAQWIGSNYWFFDYYHSYFMFAIVCCQLIATAVFGGFKDGVRRWSSNIADSDSVYLCVSGSDSQ